MGAGVGNNSVMVVQASPVIMKYKTIYHCTPGTIRSFAIGVTTTVTM